MSQSNVIQIIEFNDTLQIAQEVIGVVAVAEQGPPGAAANFVAGEVPAGSIDGSNATFATEFAFVPESVAVFVNGLAQRRVTDFVTSGEQTVILSDSPAVGESVRISYLRS